jgi:hypothetical protein
MFKGATAATPEGAETTKAGLSWLFLQDYSGVMKQVY